MAERIAINAESRSVVGKKVKRLRKQGIIPAVVYGQNEPAHIQLENLSLRRALRVAGTSQLLNLTVDGKKKVTVLAREIQQHLTRGDLIHVDFYEVDMKQTIRTDVELVAINMAVPEVEGLGVGALTMRTVEIECLPDDLISEIEVDMSKIETLTSLLSIGDLAVPKGVTILADENTTIARFQITREEVEEEDEDGIEMDPTADSVEVIAKGKEEEEDF